MMLKAKLEEPFIIYRVLPRSAIPLSEAFIGSLDISGNVLTCEENSSLDFVNFFYDLGMLLILLLLWFSRVKFFWQCYSKLHIGAWTIANAFRSQTIIEHL